MSIDVMKQALEALEYINVTAEHRVDSRIPEAAITALRAAIEQAQAPYMTYSSERMNVDPATGDVSIGTPKQAQEPLTDEMRKQMKERCDSMKMRGAFADGWLSAEAAHGIKEASHVASGI